MLGTGARQWPLSLRLARSAQAKAGARLRLGGRTAATMRAAVYHEFGGTIAVEEVPRPKAPAGGVVVEVRANGICRSDWHGWRGHDDDIVSLPHVPGHELAGVVVEVGPGVEHFAPGERVVSPFILACGRCYECTKLKQPTICGKQQQPGFHRWGSFAEYVALPRADLNLLSLPASIGFDAAAAMGCRLTTAYRAVKARGQVSKGTTVAIFGCGGVGLSAILICRALGARVVAVDVSPEARRRALELGAEVALDANAGAAAEIHKALRESTNGGADVALDCVGGAGTQSTVNAALALRRGGRLVQVALPQPEGPALPVALFAAHELELVGSHGASAQDLREVLAMTTQGLLKPEELISQSVSLSEACKLLMAMDAPDAGGVGGTRVCTDFSA